MKLSVRLEEAHEMQHEWLKDAFGLRDVHGEDSQVIKRAETIAFNVLHMLGLSQIDDIFTLKSKEELARERGIQYEKARQSRTKNGSL